MAANLVWTADYRGIRSVPSVSQGRSTGFSLLMTKGFGESLFRHDGIYLADLQLNARIRTIKGDAQRS